MIVFEVHTKKVGIGPAAWTAPLHTREGRAVVFDGRLDISRCSLYVTLIVEGVADEGDSSGKSSRICIYQLWDSAIFRSRYSV